MEDDDMNNETKIIVRYLIYFLFAEIFRLFFLLFSQINPFENGFSNFFYSLVFFSLFLILCIDRIRKCRNKEPWLMIVDKKNVIKYEGYLRERLKEIIRQENVFFTKCFRKYTRTTFFYINKYGKEEICLEIEKKYNKNKKPIFSYLGIELFFRNKVMMDPDFELMKNREKEGIYICHPGNIDKIKEAITGKGITSMRVRSDKAQLFYNQDKKLIFILKKSAKSKKPIKIFRVKEILIELSLDDIVEISQIK